MSVGCRTLAGRTPPGPMRAPMRAGGQGWWRGGPDRWVPGFGTARVDLREFERRDGEVLLRADILGHRLIDTPRGRLVRAHDLELAETPPPVDREPTHLLVAPAPRRGRPRLHGQCRTSSAGSMTGGLGDHSGGAGFAGRRVIPSSTVPTHAGWRTGRGTRHWSPASTLDGRCRSWR